MWKNLLVELNGMSRAVILSCVLGVVSAIVVYFSNLSEESFSLLGRIILAASVFTGACYTTKIRASRGLTRGLNFGLAFFILVLIASLGFHPASITLKHSLYSLGICLASGGLGGILGIGLSSS